MLYSKKHLKNKEKIENKNPIDTDNWFFMLSQYNKRATSHHRFV